MDVLRTLATLLPLSLTSGVNLYATVLVVGVSIRLGWVPQPPAGLQVMGEWPVIILAGVLYVIEFLADKIQFVDNLWDVVHTFIRPVGAAAMGLAVLSGANPIIVVIGALLAGGIALVSHGGKASARVTLNVASPLENVSNVAVSLAEDAAVGGLAFLALRYPFLAAGLALVMLGVIVLAVPPMLRWVGFVFSGLFHGAKGLGRRVLGQEMESEELPAAHLALVGHRPPELAVCCKIQNVRGASGYTGFLGVWPDSLGFTYNRWGQSRLWSLPLSRVKAAYLRPRALVTVLELHYLDPSDRPRLARFVGWKDRSALLEKIRLHLASTAVG